MRILLAEVTSRFDYVVLDSPAAFGVADPIVLSTVVDGVVVVARQGRTRRRLLQKLRARFAYARAPLVGVVLNGGDEGEPSNSYHTITVAPAAGRSTARATEAA
jgi:Mrp family chromosome partitioning ATPase